MKLRFMFHTCWLSIMEVTAQIVLVPPFFENFGKRLVKSPKLYFLDSGLACHLLGVESERELNMTRFSLRCTLGLPGVHPASAGATKPERWQQNAALLRGSGIVGRRGSYPRLPTQGDPPPARLPDDVALRAFSRSRRACPRSGKIVVLPKASTTITRRRVPARKGPPGAGAPARRKRRLQRVALC